CTGRAYRRDALTIPTRPSSDLGGSASDACGLSSITYQDSKTGSCPIVVTRTFTAKDPCLNTTIKTQTIEINDTIAPSLTAPGAKTVEGCSETAITGLPFSATAVPITLAQLQAEGGNASDACGISSITYQDSKSGSCPTVVTRTFTVKDLCQNPTSKTQTITVQDTTRPTVTITSPPSGSVYAVGTTVTFIGTFSDTCGTHTNVWYLDNTAVPGTVNEGT